MADLYNSDLGGNTRKVTPSSMFGTREIKWLQLNFDYNVLEGSGGDGAYNTPDSLYQEAVKCIQEVAEIYYLGAPTHADTSSFVFGIAADTAEWRTSENGYYSVAQSRPQGVHDLVDRLTNTFGPSYWWILQELEDCGFGLMPGNHLADPGNV